MFPGQTLVELKIEVLYISYYISYQGVLKAEGNVFGCFGQEKPWCQNATLRNTKIEREKEQLNIHCYILMFLSIPIFEILKFIFSKANKTSEVNCPFTTSNGCMPFAYLNNEYILDYLKAFSKTTTGRIDLNYLLDQIDQGFRIIRI